VGSDRLGQAALDEAEALGTSDPTRKEYLKAKAARNKIIGGNLMARSTVKLFEAEQWEMVAIMFETMNPQGTLSLN
jgi:hypothetical protein